MAPETALNTVPPAHPLIAEPGDPQMLNRYSYVRNNPLLYVDPTGLTMGIVCGLGQDCEGGEIGSFEEWVIAYWMAEQGISRKDAEARWDELTKSGLDVWGIFDKYDLLFINTDPRSGPSWWDYLLKGVPRAWLHFFVDLRWHFGEYVQHAVEMLYRGWRVAGSWDVVLGYSLGGAVLADMLKNGPGMLMTSRVILVEPALNSWIFGRGLDSLDAVGLPNHRIITVNDPGAFAGVFNIGGTIRNAIDISSGECGGLTQHCAMGGCAELAIGLAYSLPPGADALLDSWVVWWLRVGDVNASIP